MCLGLPKLDFSVYFGRDISDELLIVSEGVVYGGVIFIDGIGFVCMDDRGEHSSPFQDVTYWMPLPQPPTE